jgi:hypothetical protein
VVAATDGATLAAGVVAADGLVAALGAGLGAVFDFPLSFDFGVTAGVVASVAGEGAALAFASGAAAFGFLFLGPLFLVASGVGAVVVLAAGCSAFVLEAVVGGAFFLFFGAFGCGFVSGMVVAGAVGGA